MVKGQYTKEDIYNKIKNDILCLTLKPGDRISEAEISKTLGVSRQPVREVFIRLSYEKLLNIVPQKGTFISMIDLNYVEEVIYMRYLIEKNILVEASQVIDSRLMLELKHICDLQENVALTNGEASEFLALDNQLHRTIFEGSKHSTIWEIIESNNVHYARFRLLDALEKDSMLRIVEQHRNLLSYIEQGDTEAIQILLKKHLYQGIAETSLVTDKYNTYFL